MQSFVLYSTSSRHRECICGYNNNIMNLQSHVIKVLSHEHRRAEEDSLQQRCRCAMQELAVHSTSFTWSWSELRCFKWYSSLKLSSVGSVLCWFIVASGAAIEPKALRTLHDLPTVPPKSHPNEHQEKSLLKYHSGKNLLHNGGGNKWKMTREWGEGEGKKFPF